MNSSYDYCLDLIRNRDRDRYCCALLAPAAVRNDLFALYAFNAEIAEIAVSVSEPLIGQMRLRWWLDALPGLYAGTPPQHPVAVALSQTLARQPVQQSLLEQLLEARESDLVADPPQTLDAAVSYAEATSGRLTMLSLMIMGINHPASLQAARHIGTAWGLTGLIRSVPYQLGRGRVQLPGDLCKKHGFDRQSMLDHGYTGAPAPGFTEVISDVQAEIARHMARAAASGTPDDRIYAAPLLLKILATGYGHELERVNNDPFQLNLWRPGPRLRDMLRMKWASLTRKI